MPDLVTSGDRRGACHALLGIGGAGGDVDDVDVFFRRHVADVVRQPHIDAGGAVNARDVGLRIAAVDVGVERAAGSIGDRVLKRGRQSRRAPG